MLLRRCFETSIRHQLSCSRLLYSTEAQNGDVSKTESAPKAPRKRTRKVDREVLREGEATSSSEAQNLDAVQPERAGKAPRESSKVSHKSLLRELQTTSSLRQHHDLPSFLSYAQRVHLDPTSTVYVGTHYEYLTQTSLSRLGFTLLPTGGSNDYGIDLLGTLSLSIPRHPIQLKVIVQCKALASRGGPNLIRELEGAFNGAPVSFRGNGVMGLLVTQKPATKGMRDALGRSGWPMGCVTLTSEGKIIQMLWNRRAEEEGLAGIGVGIRYANQGTSREQEVVLLWKGEVIRAGK